MDVPIVWVIAAIFGGGIALGMACVWLIRWLGRSKRPSCPAKATTTPADPPPVASPSTRPLQTVAEKPITAPPAPPPQAQLKATPPPATSPVQATAPATPPSPTAYTAPAETHSKAGAFTHKAKEQVDYGRHDHEPGWLYLARNDAYRPGLYKMGLSRDPKHRAVTLERIARSRLRHWRSVYQTPGAGAVHGPGRKGFVRRVR